MEIRNRRALGQYQADRESDLGQYERATQIAKSEFQAELDQYEEALGYERKTEAATVAHERAKELEGIRQSGRAELVGAKPKGREYMSIDDSIMATVKARAQAMRTGILSNLGAEHVTWLDPTQGGVDEQGRATETMTVPNLVAAHETLEIMRDEVPKDRQGEWDTYVKKFVYPAMTAKADSSGYQGPRPWEPEKPSEATTGPKPTPDMYETLQRLQGGPEGPLQRPEDVMSAQMARQGQEELQQRTERVLQATSSIKPVLAAMTPSLGKDGAEKALKEMMANGLADFVEEGTPEAFRSALRKFQITDFATQEALFKVIVTGNVKNKSQGQ
jgi:hypothetical protein